MKQDIQKFKTGFELYSKEKKKLSKYKKELKEMKEKDKENMQINCEKDQAILKIKNSFMCMIYFFHVLNVFR